VYEKSGFSFENPTQVLRVAQDDKQPQAGTVIMSFRGTLPWSFDSWSRFAQDDKAESFAFAQDDSSLLSFPNKKGPR